VPGRDRRLEPSAVDRLDRDDVSGSHLSARAALVTGRLALLADSDSGDRFVSDLAAAPGLVAAVEARLDEIDPEGASSLRQAQLTFELSETEVDVLVLAAAAELDTEVRQHCGALQGASAAAHPTVGTALSVVGRPLHHRGAAGLLSEAAPLVRHHLVSIESLDQPLATRPLRVPDRVVRALLGVPGIDPILRSLETPLVGVPVPGAERVAVALRAGVRLVYVRERPAISGHAFAAAVFDHLGVDAVGFDLRRAGPDHHPYGLAAAIAREGGLLDTGVVVGPIENLVSRDVESLVPLLANPWPVVLVGASAWDPGWSRNVPLCVDATRPGPDALRDLWSSTFAERDVVMADDVASVTAVLRLTPEQTVRAALAARIEAAADGGPVTAAHVRAGARAQSAGRLEQLADRIEPRSRFDDLVLPVSQLDQVRQVVERGRYREVVLDAWQMGGTGSRGRGITALFAGDSGTGKTLSAEAIAGELGVDLYVIDLSTVVDKYVGETEKNLGRVFDEAEGINGVLFFDEADALFGKRSETSQANDRYANVEVAYLLQRMERFDGVAILATNLRSNIDDAFTRRLDIIVHFTLPDFDQRRELWRRHLPGSLPQDPDLDLEFLARRFEIAGGVIRNVTVTAAYRAAQRDDVVTMGDLIRAISAEYTKMGRLFDIGQLGAYASELDEAIDSGTC
jgi:hypothetical protein